MMKILRFVMPHQHIYDLNFLGEIIFNKNSVEYEIRTANGNTICYTFTNFDQGKDAGYQSLGAYRMEVNIKQKDYLLLSP